MGLENLRQHPFNTTLLGVMRGVADFREMAISDATLFGGTGHAFLINIHEALCPSGPYVWDRSHFSRLARNLGIEMADLGFYQHSTVKSERAAVETKLRDALDARMPCSLMNMENQLITGYDDTGFETAGPWPQNDFPPRRLTFQTWEELGEEIHLSFYTFREIEPSDRKTMVRQSLEYAVELFGNPTNYTGAPYGMGPDAYDRWLAAIGDHGASHGNWWNAVVWGECRQHAGRYMSEIAEWFPASADTARQLAAVYADIGAGLNEASDKELPTEEKKSLVAELKDRELAAVKLAEQVLVEI